MKKLLILAGMLLASTANAQFIPGQILTAAELNNQFALYAPLAGATFSGSVSAPTFTGNGSFTNLSASGTVTGLGFTNLLTPYALLSGASFTGGLSATGITSTPISGSTGAFTNLTATGTVTVPSGSLALSGLASQAANTVVANGSNSAGSPTAYVMPSCSGNTSALTWLSGTGFGCNSVINAGTLGGATFSSPNPIGSSTPSTGAFTTLSVTGNFTPSQTNGIVGTTTNNNANAGSVGEYIFNSASNVSLSNGTTANVTSISLTAGDWDVSGDVQILPAGTTVLTLVQGGINTTSATQPASTSGFAVALIQVSFTTGGLGWGSSLAASRVSIASTTTVYLVATANFTTSTCQAFGSIHARRIR